MPSICPRAPHLAQTLGSPVLARGGGVQNLQGGLWVIAQVPSDFPQIAKSGSHAPQCLALSVGDSHSSRLT